MRAKDFRQQAWSALSGRWGTMVLMGIIVEVIMGACGGLSWLGVGAIAILIITGPITLGVTIANLKLVRGENVEIGDAFCGFKRDFGNSFLLALLNEIFIGLWSLLFIIPGIIASYRYAMSYYVLADNPGMDNFTARRRSIEMMKGNKWRLFCLDLSFIGWWLLCILTFGILSFWVNPYQNAARAEFYQNLLREQGAETSNQQTLNKEEGAPAANGESVYGTGYEANPDMELGSTPANESNDTPDSEPPLNADDL